jgi:hypothetical protein
MKIKLDNKFDNDEVVVLDNKHKVVVVSQTPQLMFTKIKSTKESPITESWEVMTNRLTKKI